MWICCEKQASKPAFIRTPDPITMEPVVDTEICLGSLDARTCQYYYGLQKLREILKGIDSLSSNVKENGVTPDAYYILLLSGPTLQVNDKLQKKLESVLRGERINIDQKVQPSINTSAVSFDCGDWQPELDLKKDITSYICDSQSLISQFVHLCENAKAIYLQKLNQAAVEKAGTKPVSLFMNEFTDLLDFSMEQCLVQQLFYNLNFDKNDSDCVKAVQRDVDWDAGKVVCDNMERQLCLLARSWDTGSNGPYYCYRCCLTLLRIADFYGILRKVGKKVYRGNVSYLKQVTLYSVSLQMHLKGMDSLFNQPKKNNLLLATLVRLTRQGSNFPVRPNVTADLTKQVREGLKLIASMVSVFKGFLSGWRQAEESSQRKGPTRVEEVRIKLKHLTSEQRASAVQVILSNLSIQEEFKEKKPRPRYVRPTPKSAPLKPASRQLTTNKEPSTQRATSQVATNKEAARRDQDNISSGATSKELTPSKETTAEQVSPMRRSSSLRETASPSRSPSLRKPNAVAGAVGAIKAKSPTPTKPLGRSNSMDSRASPRPLTAQQRLHQHILSQSSSGRARSTVVEEMPKVFYSPISGMSKSGSPRLDDDSSASTLRSVNEEVSLIGDGVLNEPEFDGPELELPLLKEESGVQNGELTLPVPVSEKLPIKDANGSTGGELDKQEKNKSPPNGISEKNKPRRTDKKVSEEVKQLNGSETKHSSPDEGKPDAEETVTTRKPPSDTPKESLTEKCATPDGVVAPTISQLNKQCDMQEEVLATIKKVRFAGVPPYSAEEDMPTQGVRKVRRWPMFRTSLGSNGVTRTLDTQEGLAFRKLSSQNGHFSRYNDGTPVNGRMMSSLETTRSPKFSKLFRKK